MSQVTQSWQPELGPFRFRFSGLTLPPDCILSHGGRGGKANLKPPSQEGAPPQQKPSPPHNNRLSCPSLPRWREACPGVAVGFLCLQTTIMFSSAGLSPGQSCGFVLIFAVLVQSICVAITFLYFTNELQQLRETYSQSSLACFTRENFFLEDLDPSYNEDSDPCWQVKWQLSRLIKKMISRNYMAEGSTVTGGKPRVPATAEREASQISVPRVAAHLTANRKHVLAAQNSSFRNSVGIKINTWETSRGAHSFLYNFDLRNGELIIPQTGFYYIYSQTYFRFRELDGAVPDSEPDSDSVRNPKQMVQYIYKLTNYPDSILLMKSARTSCWSKRAGYGLYSIYQGGVFQLKQNDRIFVSINNKELVDLDNEASFFGAFLVS